jgi:hypothetical protein
MNSKIENKDAEKIGRPIIECLTKAYETSDYNFMSKNFPELTKSITQEIFSEGVKDLKPMGKVSSIDFLGLFNKTDEQLLLWNVRYEKLGNDVLWHIFLTEHDSELKTTAICII